jgi:dihydroxyacetone kinase-like predicted kinase
VRKGEAIALLDGRLVARGDDELEVLASAVSKLETADLITVFYGSGVDLDRAERARERIRSVRPDAEVEVLHGGQPHYPFLVSAE